MGGSTRLNPQAGYGIGGGPPMTIGGVTAFAWDTSRMGGSEGVQ